MEALPWLFDLVAALFLLVALVWARAEGRREFGDASRNALVTVASTFLGVSVAFHVSACAETVATNARLCALASVASEQIRSSIATIPGATADKEQDGDDRRLILQDPAPAVRTLVTDPAFASAVGAATAAGLSRISTVLSWRPKTNGAGGGDSPGLAFVMPDERAVASNLAQAQALLEPPLIALCGEE